MRKQFEELKSTGQLPSPGGVGMRILTLTQRDDSSVDELVEALSADPALTGRVIKLANSAIAGPSPVVTVREAAVRLGTRALTGVALGFSLVSDHKTGKCPNFDYDAYWAHSLLRALAAQSLSRSLGLAVPVEAFTLGLVARIGELALATVHPDDFSTLLARAEHEDGFDLRRSAGETFGIDHVEVGEAMLRDWGLPERFAMAIAASDPTGGEDADDLEDAERELIDVLRDSRILADLALRPANPAPLLAEEGRALRERLTLRRVDFELLLDQLLGEFATWGALFDLTAKNYTGGVAAGDILRRMERRSSELVDGTSEQESGAVRILAVDDDPTSLRLLTHLLGSAGHEVHGAKNGREALAATLRFRPQIVVTDWAMPDIDGLEFCRALRKTRFGRRIYVLLLTGHGDEERVLEAFDAGVDDYVVKPFKPRLLLARLRAGIRLVRLQEQAERDRAIHVRNAATQARMNRQLKEAAETDYLTQLPNRRCAMEAFHREWERAAERGTPLSLVMLDIDDFKNVNDNHGHDTGDAVLRETGRVLRHATRRMDVAARMGGEEFLVVCPGVDAEGALNLAERIRIAVESNVIHNGSFHANVTVSLGIATRTPDMGDPEQLLRRADAGVYRAKQLGRNRVERVSGPDSGARSA